jgi:hypothetical protein
MSDSLLSDYAQSRRRFERLERIESTARRALTLTRTATLSLTTAGTVITWQQENRAYGGMTWSGTDITIPASGYYHVSLAIQVATAIATMTVRYRVGGNAVIHDTGPIGSATRQNMATSAIVYCAASDVLSVQLVPSVNVTLDVNAETAANASPILHIVSL